ncbi:helix-turn-helix domain-containing protein [Mesonia mobilis]|uniref:helix-turn-helix domain-containing protein n=1 Tax=Mesonia mobilis TaxID=369791 RepID=UPI0035713316
MESLLNSRQVMELLNIKSPTTLIKYEAEGTICVHARLGNRKRYRKSDIKKLL